MKVLVICIIATVLVICIGTCIYSVGNVSATIPPIKEYEYQGSADQLITKMKLFALTKPKITFEVGRVLGSQSTGYAQEITIKIKDQSDDLLYDFHFENIDGIKTKLILIGAHNLNNDTGGYGLKAIGMKIILDKFNSEIISPLRKEASVTITAMQTAS